MPFYPYKCNAGHETDRFYKMSDTRPSSIRCACGRSARRQIVLPQLITDIPEHFNTSLGKPVKSRAHLRQLQQQHGCQDVEGGVPDPPSDWK